MSDELIIGIMSTGIALAWNWFAFRKQNKLNMESEDREIKNDMWSKKYDLLLKLSAYTTANSKKNGLNLNTILVVFYDEEEVINRYKEYLDIVDEKTNLNGHRIIESYTEEPLDKKITKTYIAMLEEMKKALKVNIKNLDKKYINVRFTVD